MDYDVILTDTAQMHAQKILDYLFFELMNRQAVHSVEQDMKDTVKRLSYLAGSLKLCDDPELRSRGYRTIHFKRHKYFMLYKIVDTQVFIVGIYHDLQDYEHIFQ